MDVGTDLHKLLTLLTSLTSLTSLSCLTDTFIDKFKSLSKMPNIKCPVQIFHGVIPMNHGIALNNVLMDKRFNIKIFQMINYTKLFITYNHLLHLQHDNVQYQQ